MKRPLLHEDLPQVHPGISALEVVEWDMGLLDSVKSSVTSAMTQVKAAVIEAPPPPPPPPAPTPTGHSSASTFDAGGTPPLTGGAGLPQLASDAPTFRASDLQTGSAQELVRTTVVDKSAAAPGTPAFQSQVTDIELGIVDMYMKTGQHQNAKALLDHMEKNNEHLDANRQAFQQKDCLDVNGRVSESRSKEDGGVMPVMTTDRQLIADKRAQLKVAEDMSKVVGKPVDPSNLEQAKEYFDKLSAQKPKVETKVISEKFGDYAKAFHRFDGHDWPKAQPGEKRDDAATVSKMFDTQPHDSAGCSVLDCEGTTYLAASMFKNNPRFDVTYAATKEHISACVFEKGTTKGFSVNTLNQTDGKTLLIDEKKTSKPIAEQQKAIAGVRHGVRPQKSDDGVESKMYCGPNLETANAQ
ncbi:MAG: hypothetical protein QM817_17540 [Archangium sp.]